VPPSNLQNVGPPEQLWTAWLGCGLAVDIEQAAIARHCISNVTFGG